MKEKGYLEGTEATENFEEGMKTLFKAFRAAIVQARNKKQEESIFAGCPIQSLP